MDPRSACRKAEPDGGQADHAGNCADGRPEHPVTTSTNGRVHTLHLLIALIGDRGAPTRTGPEEVDPLAWAGSPTARDRRRAAHLRHVDVTFLTVVVSPADLPVQWSKMPTNLAGIEVVAVNANEGVSPS